MVAIEQIKRFSEDLVREFHPRQVILFGSYARGNPTPDSDVDLLVVLPFKGKAVQTAVQIQLRLRPSFPIDLIVRTPEKVRERIEMGDCFMKEVMETGKVLYERDRR